MYFKKNDCVDHRFEPVSLTVMSAELHQQGGFDRKNTGYAVFIFHFRPDIYIRILPLWSFAAEPDSPRPVDLSAEGYDDIH